MKTTPRWLGFAPKPFHRQFFFVHLWLFDIKDGYETFKKNFKTLLATETIKIGYFSNWQETTTNELDMVDRFEGKTKSFWVSLKLLRVFVSIVMKFWSKHILGILMENKKKMNRKSFWEGLSVKPRHVALVYTSGWFLYQEFKTLLGTKPIKLSCKQIHEDLVLQPNLPNIKLDPFFVVSHQYCGKIFQSKFYNFRQENSSKL